MNQQKTAVVFTDLIVWQKAHQFVLRTYQYTTDFPKEEIYGLVSQLRRVAISVAANITEGFKKKGRKDKVRFLNIAQGSAKECRYYLILSADLAYGSNSDLTEQLGQVSKLLESYPAAIQNSIT